MKKKTVILNTLLTTMVILMSSACTGYFEKLNQDVFGVSEEELNQDGLALGGMLQQLERAVIIYRDGNHIDSDYQIAYNLCADTWCGYSSPTHTWEDGEHGSWLFADKWCRSMYSFKYLDCMGGFKAFEAEATRKGHEAELALATVLKVAAMHQVADYYGPISYSQYGGLTNLYDPQDQVYEQFFNELDASIDKLTSIASSGVKLLEDYDLIYGGDVTRWVRFANSLRLRLAMRISYADPLKAREEAEKSLSHPLGLILSNSDNAVNKEAGYHPIREAAFVFNDGECHMGASMDCYLNGYADPRGTRYFIAAGDGKLHGVRPGITPSVWTNYLNPANRVSKINADALSVTWMNAAEVAFLCAEAALKGWDAGRSAQDYYEMGVKLSFEEWNVEGAASYLNNTTAKPAAFDDVVGRAKASAPSTVTIAWNNRDTDEQKLEKIATQKWLALYPNGAEAWAEQRRLHYPVLVAPNSNRSNGTVITEQGARRVPYPADEAVTNPEAYASAVAALGGRDDAGVRLWWDAKPFNN